MLEAVHTPAARGSDTIVVLHWLVVEPSSEKTMKRKWISLVAAASVIGVLISGCAWQIGGDKGKSEARPTRGQELIDLKKAREQGAITEDEYQVQRNKILGR